MKTGYELSRSFWDFSFENASLIKPAHAALYFFIIEHNNRLGWKKEFGLPRQMAMDAIGIKNNRTFTKVFEDLIEWGFITILERSKNQYSANIIALSKNTPAPTKALDKAIQKHVHKHSTGIAPIDKPLNNETNKPLNQDYCEKDFLKDWNELRTKHFKKPSHLNNIGGGIERSSFNDLLESYSRDDFKNALIGLFKQNAWPNDNSQMASNPKHFLTHFNTYLTAFHDRNTELYGKQKTEATL